MKDLVRTHAIPCGACRGRITKGSLGSSLSVLFHQCSKEIFHLTERKQIVSNFSQTQQYIYINIYIIYIYLFFNFAIGFGQLTVFSLS